MTLVITVIIVILVVPFFILVCLFLCAVTFTLVILFLRSSRLCLAKHGSVSRRPRETTRCTT